MKLRPYQQHAVDNAINELATNKSTLVVLPTGGGKTILFAKVAEHFMQTGRVMVIAHREELIRQAASKIKAVTNYQPSVEMADEWSAEDGFSKPKIVVSSVQTLCRGRVERFRPEDFSLVITDECFPAGTLIDGKPIETINVGDMVNSINHKTGSIEKKRVTAVMVNNTMTPLVDVKLSNGITVTCTPGHPFWTPDGYVYAISLARGSMVATITHDHIQEYVHFLPSKVRGTVQQKDVLAGVRNITEKESSQEVGGAVRVVQDTNIAKGSARKAEVPQDWSRVLLQRVPGPMGIEELVREHVEDQHQVLGPNLQEDDRKEPDENAWRAREGFLQAAFYRMEADYPQGERTRDDGARTIVCFSDWVEPGCRQDGGAYGEWVSNLLQSGRGERSTQDCGGDRRKLTQGSGSAAAGPEERSTIEVAWVESVSLHERAGGGERDQVCAGSVVFNLEVEDNHNYFANGVLVHNCHHSTATSYATVYSHMLSKGCKHLGVTATPDRADEQALGKVFDTVAYDYELPNIIEDGWLVPVKQRLVTVTGLDYSRAKVTAGDLNQGDVAAAQANESILHEMIDPIIEIVGKRKTIIFATPGSKKPTEDDEGFHIAERMTEIINRYKANSARRVSQDTPKDERRQMLAEFAEGKFQFLVNVGVLTEGFDDPSIEVVAITRPTKSRSLYSQCVGRGTRPLPGIVDQYEHAHERRHAIKNSTKPHVEVLDFVGNSGRHKLVNTADILGGNYEQVVIDKAVKKATEESVDMTEALKEAYEETKDEREKERRAKILAKTKFQITDVDPFDVFDLQPIRERAWDKGKPPTPAQLHALRSMGIPQKQNLTRAQAGQLLSEAYRRRDEGLVAFHHIAKGAEPGMKLTELNKDRFTSWQEKYQKIVHST